MISSIDSFETKAGKVDFDEALNRQKLYYVSWEFYGHPAEFEGFDIHDEAREFFQNKCAELQNRSEGI
jgi:hypothetical protein